MEKKRRIEEGTMRRVEGKGGRKERCGSSSGGVGGVGREAEGGA